MENKELIARFMGVAPDKKGWYGGQELSKAGLPFACGADGNGTYYPKFLTSWDWLMPVIKKMNVTEEWEEYEISRLSICLVSVDLEASYNEVIHFIKWYNEKKSTNELAKEE
jgi:hypothetical protein